MNKFSLYSFIENVLLGGYSSEVPPLPIPNREVKLTYADGTAAVSYTHLDVYKRQLLREAAVRNIGQWTQV